MLINLIIIQVNVMTFLAFLLKRNAERYIVHSSEITILLPPLSNIVIRLPKDCCAALIRTQLVISVQRIVNYNFKTIYFHKLNNLLHESTFLRTVSWRTIQLGLQLISYQSVATIIPRYW